MFQVKSYEESEIFTRKQTFEVLEETGAELFRQSLNCASNTRSTSDDCLLNGVASLNVNGDIFEEESE
jgi:hypothetical protein